MWPRHWKHRFAKTSLFFFCWGGVVGRGQRPGHPHLSAPSLPALSSAPGTEQCCVNFLSVAGSGSPQIQSCIGGKGRLLERHLVCSPHVPGREVLNEVKWKERTPAPSPPSPRRLGGGRPGDRPRYLSEPWGPSPCPCLRECPDSGASRPGRPHGGCEA